MRAKDYLKRLEEIDTEIRIKNDELIRFQEEAGTPKGYNEAERVRSSRTINDKMAEVIARYAEIKDKLIRENLDLAKERQSILDTLSQLSTTDHEILYSKYAKYESFYEIGSRMEKSYRWVIGKHGMALKHLQDLLDEKGQI